MTVEEKLFELATKLVAKTDAGDVSWEETGEASKYLTTFPHMSVAIASTSIEDRWGNTKPGHAISLIDSEGRPIEHLELEKHPQQSNPLADLFVRAKRQAFRVDQVLDEILAELA